MKDYSVLRNVTLFSRLTDKQLRVIYRSCAVRVFQPGDIVVEQGNPGVGLFIIQEGQVKISKVLKDGSVLDIAENGPGDVIGEMSVLDGSMRTASVHAVTKASCLVLAGWTFKALMEARPEIALGVLPIVVKRYCDASDMIASMRGNKGAEAESTE